MNYNKRYPLKHLSIRVPWHDNQYNGTICNNVTGNDSCLILKNCATNRNDKFEANNGGRRFNELEEKDIPPCLSERAAFMADFETQKEVAHPYANNAIYNHFENTAIHYLPYSAPAVPFYWLLPDNAKEKAVHYNLDFEYEREPFNRFYDPKLSFTKSWIQDKTNQTSLFNAFFGHLKAEKSLCFIYSKDVPFVETSGRVLIGVGLIKSIGDTKEYNYSGDGDFRAMIWEHMVSHTIRPEGTNGFLLPYHEAIEHQKKNENFNPEELAVIVPNENKFEFSYASEHVENDSARTVLLLCINKIRRAKELGIGDGWDQKIKWLHDRISEIEELRSDYSGLGSALCAFGLEQGHFVAQDIYNSIGPKECPWEYLELVFKDPNQYLSDELSDSITKVEKDHWAFLKSKTERFRLLQLLSRFNLTIDQSSNWFDEENRSRVYSNITDKEIVVNPYLMFENSIRCLETDRISLAVIDLGMMLNRSSNLLPYNEKFSPNDPRRIRAFCVYELENAAQQGHTLLPQNEILNRISEEPFDPPCEINTSKLEFAAQSFKPTIVVHETQDKTPAYQLKRLNDASKLINEKISKRLTGERHKIEADWDDVMRSIIDSSNSPINWDSTESSSREEKLRALEELAGSRFSVLIGPAGSGKTTLLAALASIKSINEKNVLMLAPTGKARVRMEVYARSYNVTVKTIASFLHKSKRFRGSTQTFHLNNNNPVSGYKTVIIDECSMLTEEMLAATLENIKGVERLILVGDPRQLPPIGPGRPFVDIIKFIKEKNIEYKFPRIGKSYVELTQSNRQIGNDRLDLEFANLFSGEESENVDEIFRDAVSNKSDFIKVVPWENEKDFEEKLFEELEFELHINDYKTFNKSFEKNEVNSNESVHNVDSWQILCAVKSRGFGSNSINRVIHEKYKKGLILKASNKWSKSKSFGSQQIVWSDKVINLQNKSRDADPKGINFVANGEIGMVKSANKYYLNVEFSSQIGHTYGYPGSEFKEEGDVLLELAYSLTIHKAQGSDFDVVFLVIPDPCLLLSRELIYTALTRQKTKVILMYQGNPVQLYPLMGDYYSDTFNRVTNLFYKPNVTVVKNKFFEKNLIHCASDETMLRSKSELIIYEALLNNGLEPIYEYELKIDGITKRPDFTILDDDLGENFYWEHLGMLSDTKYKLKWEQKKNWYKENGILTKDEGVGHAGTLIITKDDARTGISLKEINSIIRSTFKKSPEGDTEEKLNEIIYFDKDLRELIFSLKEQLSKLSNDLVEIKSSNQETDVKIDAIYTKLDNENFDNVGIESYESSVKDLLSDYKLLESESFDFIVTALFIRGKLEDSSAEDFSMYILQYCRAIENELLKKVFITYYDFLNSMKEEVKENLLMSEFQNKKSGVFAKMLFKGHTKFTLGMMEKVLSFIWKANGRSLQSSPLLQSFRSHVVGILNQDFLNKDQVIDLGILIQDFRNKAAHTEIIPKSDMSEFTNIANHFFKSFLNAINNKLQND